MVHSDKYMSEDEAQEARLRESEHVYLLRNGKCPICELDIDGRRTVLAVPPYHHLMNEIVGIVINDTLYCSSCVERATLIMADTKKTLLPKS